MYNFNWYLCWCRQRRSCYYILSNLLKTWSCSLICSGHNLDTWQRSNCTSLYKVVGSKGLNDARLASPVSICCFRLYLRYCRFSVSRHRVTASSRLHNFISLLGVRYSNLFTFLFCLRQWHQRTLVWPHVCCDLQYDCVRYYNQPDKMA